MKKFILLFLFIPLFSAFSEYKWEKDTVLFAWSKTFLVKDSSNNYYYSAGKGPYISTDNMKTWKEALLLLKTVRGMAITPQNRLIIASDSIYYTDDFGISYYHFPITTKPYKFVRAAYLSIIKDTIAFCSYWSQDTVDYSVITYSTDLGKSLFRTITKVDSVKINKPQNGIDILISDIKGHHFYMNFYSGIFYIPSLTDTLHFNVYKFPNEAIYSDLKIINDTTLLLLYNGQLKYTSDQGKNWFDFPNQPAPFYTIGTNGNKLLAVDGPNCWLTSDFGKTWEIIYDDASSPSGVGIPFIADNDKVLIVKPYLYVYKGELVTDVVEDKIEKDFEVSPNPATDFIEIAYPPLERWSGGVTIKIYNVFGQLQTTPNPTPALPASGEGARIDVSGLAPGMYFVRVGERVGKFIKL